MTAYALITGSLFRRPEQRLSKTGKFFTTATLRVVAGAGFQFWNTIAFSESVQAELLRLEEGDAVSVHGPLKVELQDHAGEKRISFSLTVENALALRQPPRPREKKNVESQPPKQVARPAPPAPFDDDVPF